MDDQIVETLSHNCDHGIELSPTCEAEQSGANIASVYKSDLTDGTREMCSDEEQTLPMLQKIEALSSKVQNLKKEHELLCNEVKGITADSFPGSDIFTALQGLSTEHEHLKKKYHEECLLLKKKYLEEWSERKQLYNEVIELKGNIRVFCRCRPLNQGEIASGSASIVDFDSSQENELQIICSDSSRKQFKFDYVFRPEDNQESVFVQTLPMVTSVLDGYNVCIFAYGQTGTGKTFTMEGTAENRGVNYRTLEELFRISSERSSVMRYELSVSMLEVYNEKIRDLLIENSTQPAKKLEIKQTAEGTQEVPGLVEIRVYDTNEVWELLKSGSQARSVGSTNANELSSRSHCLLRVTVKGESLADGPRTRSHLWLVDLAGSERVGRLEVEGERLKESQFINKSLSALGDVISALASKTAHIPYRNSKLTHMLQSSLGGDCKTLMFVQISPCAADLGETLCSLNFASRVRGIEHGPSRRQTDLAELFKYKQLAEKAKHDEKETRKLQDSLQSLQLRFAAREHTCRSLQEKVRDLENQLAEERKTRLKQETRVLAAASAHSAALSALNQVQKPTAEKRPPLPTKLRMPLRRITNFLPPPSSIPPCKSRTSISTTLPVSTYDKENLSKMVMSATKTKTSLKARRGSFVFKPPPASNQVVKSKRRASIATLRPELNSNMKTPLDSSTARLRTDCMMGRQSFGWDPQRVWRTSRLHSPLPKLKEAAATTLMATPTAPRSPPRLVGSWKPKHPIVVALQKKHSVWSPLPTLNEAADTTVMATPAAQTGSKVMRSPPTLVGSWKPKHPTVVALQKKHLVWSPLKLRGMRNNRKSLLPS